jgi:hypothetical protein
MGRLRFVGRLRRMLLWEKLWTANTVKPTIAYLQERRQKPAMSDQIESTNQQKPSG